MWGSENPLHFVCMSSLLQPNVEKQDRGIKNLFPQFRVGFALRSNHLFSATLANHEVADSIGIDPHEPNTVSYTHLTLPTTPYV